MAEEVFTTGRITRGRLTIRNAERVAAALKQWRDGEVSITIERHRELRSLASNRLYWGVYIHTLAEYTGHHPDELHAILKAKFLPKRLALSDGNGEIVDEYVIGGSTRKLDTLEFSDYLRDIKQWALDMLGVVIPEPDEA